MQVINYMHYVDKEILNSGEGKTLMHSLIANLITRELSGCFVERINIQNSKNLS